MEDKHANSFHAKTRADWRRWLEENHESAQSLWLIIYNKDSGVPTVYYDEAVEEALCFGWIDSTANKRDSKSRYLYFTKRKPKSNWSKANKERVERLQKAGKILPPGQAMIDLAKTTGTWDAITDAEDGVIPPDLQALLDNNEKALANFMAFPPSSKRMILEWIINAKRPETRQKRLEEIVALAEKNIRANHPKK